MSVAGILLAAGTSRRFGGADKLLAPLNGRPLITYAAQTMHAFAPDILIAVARSRAVVQQLDGYDIVDPEEVGTQQADSLRAAMARAEQRGAARVVIALADMPCVTVSLLQEVTNRCSDAHPSSATDGWRPHPPACFPKTLFPALRELRGDRGAASLLQSLPAVALVKTARSVLQDVDTLDGLARLQSN